jgi:hypothetical protein
MRKYNFKAVFMHQSAYYAHCERNICAYYVNQIFIFCFFAYISVAYSLYDIIFNSLVIPLC